MTTDGKLVPETESTEGGRRRIAVVVFNLGGPDRPESVRPFLFNLFNDKSIIRVPSPFRMVLASLISRRRAPEASRIYEEIGGGSPLLPNTVAQAEALESRLGELGDVKVIIAMRYWHPMSVEAVEQVQSFDPDEVVLLPLYPQFSTTTTGSSLRVWREAALALGFDRPAGNSIDAVSDRDFALEFLAAGAILAMHLSRLAEEIVAVEVPQRKKDPVLFDTDESPRRDTSIEALAKLRPAFKKDGSVTAGNAPGVNDGASAKPFGTRILAQPPMFCPGGNAIGEAVAFAAQSIETNKFKGTRRVIDVSGDGPNTIGPPVEVARDMAVMSGITINGLVIDRPSMPDLDRYFRAAITGGPRSFVIKAESRKTFAEAILKKMILEIAGGPPPIRHARR